MGRIEDRLRELGLTLPAPPAPLANYVPAHKVGSLVYTAGQPAIANGASDLFVEVFGETGRHARTTIGVNELPAGFAVEVEVIAEV